MSKFICSGAVFNSLSTINLQLKHFRKIMTKWATQVFSGAAAVDSNTPFLFFFFYFSCTLCLSLTIDSLPNRQHDLDWTLMGGDFQFDPRLKRHHIVSVARVLCMQFSHTQFSQKILHSVTKRNALLYSAAHRICLADMPHDRTNSWPVNCRKSVVRFVSYSSQYLLQL